MKTLLLDQSEWDLVLDASSNIAVASEPYSIAQDVASAVRVFRGELWYDIEQGVPYTQGIFGVLPNLQFVRSQIEEAALKVPGVVHARCVFTTFNDRTLTGKILVTDKDGTPTEVSF